MQLLQRVLHSLLLLLILHARKLQLPPALLLEHQVSSDGPLGSSSDIWPLTWNETQAAKPPSYETLRRLRMAAAAARGLQFRCCHCCYGI
jgi:hypothetical protein